MSGLFGGSSGKSQAPESFLLTGGGAGAPWNFGVSPFDQSSIDTATSTNIAAIQNRYNQLGLGGGPQPTPSLPLAISGPNGSTPNPASAQAPFNPQAVPTGPSTMEIQDILGAQQAGTAMTGELQTANEANPALNPALQPQLNNLIGSIGGTQSNSLSNLANLAGLGSSLGGGLSNLLGGLGGGAAAGGLADTLAGGAGADIAGGISASDIALALPFLGL